MMKMFHQRERAGSTAAYWEEEWGVLDPARYAADARRHCEASPIWKLVTSTVQPDRLFIDGGCGHGYWVKCLHDRGQKAAGVDFAENTLNQIRRIDPQIDVRFGDVRALPFRDEEVHVYYSGGVVEHFEDGPTAALKEARRVLARDGWFLCSVPDQSPLRAQVLYRRATEMRDARNGPLVVRRVPSTRIDVVEKSTTFFQYVFTEDEFRERLRLAGFDVVDTFGMSFVWGFLEMHAMRRLHDRAQFGWRALRAGRNGTKRPEQVPADTGSKVANGNSIASLRALPRRILMNEDRTIPLLGGAVKFVAEFAANLRMYVARPAGVRLPARS